MATRSSRQTNKMRRLSLSPQSVLDFRSRCLRRHRRRCRRPRRTFLHADALQARREQARPSVGPDRRGIRARSGERRRRHRRRSTTQTALWRRGRRREREAEREGALQENLSLIKEERERELKWRRSHSIQRQSSSCVKRVCMYVNYTIM